MNLYTKILGERMALKASYWLMGLLLIQLFVLPVFPLEWHALLYNIAATTIYLNLILVINNHRNEILAAMIVLIFLEWFFFFMEISLLNQLAYGVNMVLFFVIIIKFLIQIAKAGKVDMLAILQCINGYLLLGMLSGVTIGFITLTNPEAFIFPETSFFDDDVFRMSEFQYMGLVTLSTLGFGDITPISPAARSITTFIAVVGQLYVAIIIALLVGRFSSSSSD